MEIDANLVLSLFWLVLSAGVLLPGIWLLTDGKTHVRIIDALLQRFYLFGKLKNQDQSTAKVLGDVPKRYFSHFYIVGLLINVPLFLTYRSPVLLFTMFTGHMCRRLYECLYVHRFGRNSTMSCIHYLTGAIHYPAVGLTVLVDEAYGAARSSSSVNTCIVLLLFVNASMVQYHVHCTLAQNRRTENETYPIPKGYWPFDYFSCPNYIAEMFIYIAFLLASHRTSSMMSMTVWVMVNQCLSALLAHRWYRQHYGSTYPSSRRALLPFLL